MNLVYIPLGRPMGADARFWVCLLIACVAHALLFLPLSFPTDHVTRLEITLAPWQSEITANETLSSEEVMTERATEGAAEGVMEEAQLETIAEPEPSTNQSLPPANDLAIQAVESAFSASNQQHGVEPASIAKESEPPTTYEKVSEATRAKEIAPSEPQDFTAFNIAQIAGLKSPSNAWQRNLQPAKIKRLANGDAETIAEQYYLQSWRRKVQAIGKRNYPAAAKLFGLSGSLRLLVSVRHDGTLVDVRVLIGSGHDVLDSAAIKIINLASPFAPFPEQIRRHADVLEIVHDWEFRRKSP